MKKFKSALLESKNEVLEMRKKKVSKEHKLILESVKDEYNITDFSLLPKDKKQAMKSLILELWNPKTGITNKGIKFINESVTTLTPDSTGEDIKKYVNALVNKNINTFLQSIQNPEKIKRLIDKVHNSIMDMTKKKIKREQLAHLIQDTLAPAMKKRIS